MAHLPLKFTLTSGQTAEAFPGRWRSGEVLSPENQDCGKGACGLQADWEWLFESGSDAADTEAGSQGGVYMLMLSIYAQGGVDG